MNGFEDPYPDTELGRIIMTEFNTWGYKWDVEGPKVNRDNSNLLLAIHVYKCTNTNSFIGIRLYINYSLYSLEEKCKYI